MSSHPTTGGGGHGVRGPGNPSPLPRSQRALLDLIGKNELHQRKYSIQYRPIIVKIIISKGLGHNNGGCGPLQGAYGV